LGFAFTAKNKKDLTISDIGASEKFKNPRLPRLPIHVTPTRQVA
jgi:hypothetical protein